MSQASPSPRPERNDALAAAFAQEIKNPLSTIRMTLQLLREELADAAASSAARAVRRVDSMLVELERVDRILADFIRLGHDPQLSVAPTDVNSLIEDIIAGLRGELAEQGVAAVLQLDRRLDLVPLDPAWFRQAVTVLIRNAIQAMGQGGTLTAQTGRDDRTFALQVIDTGRGIEADVLPRVFEAFFSTKPGAPGVGLCVARQIIERHQGSIACESAVGLGTRITIRLPLRAEASPA